MTAAELYKNGRLDQAIETLSAEVRDHPTDAQRRTFLFELLCFAGKYDRAEKQLNVLGSGSHEAEMGGLLYHAALHAERTRQEMFDSRNFPASIPPQPVSGTLNGVPFSTLTDADPRIGARFEVFAAGQYMWLPFNQMASAEMRPPKQLRDLLWAPTLVRPSESYQGYEMGEVLIPVLAPLTWREDDGNIRLGRLTEWRSGDEDADVPVGQRLLLVDGEEFPLLEIRELVIAPASAALE